MPFRSVVKTFQSSARELTRVRSLTAAAMLLALQVLLEMTKAIVAGPYIRISFGYLALATTGALLGPVPAMINGALADLLGCLIHPTGPYFPGFTLTGVVGGLIYGSFLYGRSPATLRRAALTKLTVDVVCNLLLNTLWLMIMNGKAFWALLPPRLIKNAVQYLVDVPLLYAMLRLLPRLQKQLGRK